MNVYSAHADPALLAPNPIDAETADGIAIARLYGEAMFKMPADLYIPPEALKVFLEAFEGPLDLLLYLIRRQNFNILDIPMAQLTKQYLQYIDQIRVNNLELAAEYLLMAAALIEIKSRLLLPSAKSGSGEEEEDPRAELVRRLLEYEKIKLAALQIGEMPQLGHEFLRPCITVPPDPAVLWPAVAPSDLHAAFAEVIKRSKLTVHHTISRQALSVREHMSSILRYLQVAGFVEFFDLFDPSRGTAVVVVNFLALLELAKETLVEITQAEALAPIYVRLAHSHD
jgi:segregation and condensation protein A